MEEEVSSPSGEMSENKYLSADDWLREERGNATEASEGKCHQISVMMMAEERLLPSPHCDIIYILIQSEKYLEMTVTSPS